MTQNITSSGTYIVGDGEKIKVDIPGGGDVILQAPSGDDDVGKVKVEYGSNDGQPDKVTIDLSTFDENDLHIDIFKYDSSDKIILQGATLIEVDPTDSSKYSFTYVGEDGNTYTGFVHLKDRDEKDWSDPDQPINICFTKGTYIKTPDGEVLIEDLQAGDYVITQGSGPQKIRWIGSKQLDSIDLAQYPDLRPIRICANAISPGVPTRALAVSPQHRIYLQHWGTELLFGQNACLVAAKHLVNGGSIHKHRKTDGVQYFHMLLDRHEIVTANGCETESLYLGDMAKIALAPDALREIQTLFPEIVDSATVRAPTTMPVLKSFEVRALQRLHV